MDVITRFKEKRVKDKKYEKHLQGQPCMICLQTGEPHHLLRTKEKGLGVKSGSDKCIVLCHRHHMELHASGNETEYLSKHGINEPEELAKELYRKWKK